MNRVKQSAFTAIAVIMFVASFAFGQMQKQINYTINVPYSIKMGDYLLSPGKYVLYQVSANDTDTFALYAENMRHSPVAMIRTVRVQYETTNSPSKTRIKLDYDEEGNTAMPVIRGWTIPGEDGYRIISVVAKDHRYMTRLQ